MDQKTFNEAVKAEGVTGDFEKLVRSIFKQESGGGKNTKTSNRGAVGGMQIIPGTFASVADKGWDINNPLDNARAGIRYLAQMHKVSGGDPSLTAVGYYGGPGAIAKAKKGIAVSDPKNPKAPNTFQYAEQVVGRMGKDNAAPAQSNPMQSFAPVGRPSPQQLQQIQVQPPQPTQAPMQAFEGTVSQAPTMSYRDQVAQEMEAFMSMGQPKSEVEALLMAQAQQEAEAQQAMQARAQAEVPAQEDSFMSAFNYVTPQGNTPLQGFGGFTPYSAFNAWGRG